MTNCNSRQKKGMEEITNVHQRLNFKLSIQMAAPHTWPASVIPVLFSGALVFRQTHTLNWVLWISLILISILMQSGANIFNDYFDLLRGTDSTEDFVEPDDAILVYNKIPPKQALFLGIGTMVAALALSIYPIMEGGFLVLGIGILGGIILLAYSAGATPISSTPFGEVASGVTMGTFIPMACVAALTGKFYPPVILDSLPITLGISLMMMTNNTCDIEKDLRVQRSTLPILLGRAGARKVYRVLLLVWLFLLGGYAAFRFPVQDSWTWSLLLCCIFLAILCGKALLKQLKFDLNPPCRPKAMKNIAALNGLLGLFYTLWLVL